MKKFGIPYLFLDPEYLGRVDYWSFLLLGGAFGGFLLTWNITTYILHSFRFPFLATLERPFVKYCLNNSLIPIIFVILYFVQIITFQSMSELEIGKDILLQLAGFLSGFFIVISISITYFFSTNKNIFKMFGIKRRKRKQVDRHIKVGKKQWKDTKRGQKKIEVRYYLSNPFKIKFTRNVDHYDKALISSVLRHHHLNSLIVELITLATLVSLGLLVDYPIFRFPAGASVLLVFAIMMMFVGAFSFWLRGWRVTVFILFFIGLNFLVKYELIEFKNKAYGINYESEYAHYGVDSLKEFSWKGAIEDDRQNMQIILSNWQNKLADDLSKGELPKMIFINTSGGGLRSAVWTTHILQEIDKLSEGKIFNQSFMITGASAGMIGAAYYRELYLRDQLEGKVNRYDRKYVDNIAKDMLNPMAYVLLVSDIFFPLQKFKVGDYTYRKDRGYIFERQLNENTEYFLDKSLIDYEPYEKSMLIPMMVISPTINNDGRKLFISTQPVSFLTRPTGGYHVLNQAEIDGVDFQRLFVKQDAGKLKFTSALRMNATFPYISPNVMLPSNPVIQVTDAGMRDNFGFESSIRFLYLFKEWILNNTSGVIFIQIRDSRKFSGIKSTKRQSLIDQLFNPIGDFYMNWDKFQDYNNDKLLEYASAWMEGKIDVVRFEYIPSSMDEVASLSWHLTTKEKENIINSINSAQNKRSLTRLDQLL